MAHGADITIAPAVRLSRHSACRLRVEIRKIQQPPAPPADKKHEAPQQQHQPQHRRSTRRRRRRRKARRNRPGDGFVGGWIFGLLGIRSLGGIIGSVVVAFIGAVVLVWITRLLKKAA